MTKWYSKKLIYCHCFSFWRHNVYQPSLDTYNFCLCRTITGLFSTLKIARACFCCVCLISLTAMSKHRSWGGGEHIYVLYIYIYINRNSCHTLNVGLFRVESGQEWDLFILPYCRQKLVALQHMFFGCPQTSAEECNEWEVRARTFRAQPSCCLRSINSLRRVLGGEEVFATKMMFFFSSTKTIRL